MEIEEIRAFRPYNYIKHSELGICIFHRFIQGFGLVIQPVDTANFILEQTSSIAIIGQALARANCNCNCAWLCGLATSQ